MPLPRDLVPPAPAGAGRNDAAFFGAHWAFRLCVALLLLFGLSTGLRFLRPASQAQVETVVQMIVTPEISAAASRDRSEVTAPDPGDTLP